MRVFLYCIDALEYDYVFERDFPNIKQAQTERVHIPKNCMSLVENGLMTPYSPVMWKQILTGRIDTETLSRKPDRYNNSVLNWMLRRKFIKKIYRGLIGESNLIKRGFPARIGFGLRNILEGEDSLISQPNSIILRNPVIDEVLWKNSVDFDFRELIKKFGEVFNAERIEVLERITEEWDFFLFYTKILDRIGHLMWGFDEGVLKYYRYVEALSREIKSNLPKDVVMIILSDHGMRSLKNSRIGGRHSHHAFFSSSHPFIIPDDFNILHIRGIIEGFKKLGKKTK